MWLAECWVDGFTHPRFGHGWKKLIQTALEWAKQAGFRRCRARVATSDPPKLEGFESLGFAQEGAGEDFVYAGTGPADRREVEPDGETEFLRDEYEGPALSVGSLLLGTAIAAEKL